MIKKIFVLCSLLFVAPVAETFSIGIGARAGAGWNSLWGGGILLTPLANDAASGVPLHLGFDFNIRPDYAYINISGDYWIINYEAADMISGILAFYAGLGVAFNIGISGVVPFGMAIRVPVGFDFDFDIVDIFFEVVPKLGLNLIPFSINNDWVSGALGLRVWF